MGQSNFKKSNFGKSDFGESNLSALADYFASGCKTKKLFGLELEHFVVDADTRLSVPYYDGVELLLNRLQPIYGEPVFSQGHLTQKHLIGIIGKDASITLEPAGQLEISIAPKSDINEIEKIYDKFTKIISPILSDMNCELVCEGYHPKSKVDDLPLLPKRRYEFMERHFLSTGTRGKYMMKGTAATQVSIDYESEPDFSKKFRVANIIGPLLSFMYDNTSVFEGEPYEGRLIRTHIWNDVDPARSMVAAGALDKIGFGFCDYAEYVYGIPPIFVVEDGQEKFTGASPASEIFANRLMSRQDIEHLISMSFPDVRLKTSLEIRMVDSMPFKSAMAYMKLLERIFYNEATLDMVYQKTIEMGNSQVAELKERLMNL